MLVAKVMRWVDKVHPQLVEAAQGWPGPPAVAPSQEQADLLTLQAIASHWQRLAPPGTVDSIFRTAVLHGVSVKYEVLMMVEDPANKAKHWGWAITLAARSAACLALIGGKP